MTFETFDQSDDELTVDSSVLAKKIMTKSKDSDRNKEKDLGHLRH